MRRTKRLSTTRPFVGKWMGSQNLCSHLLFYSNRNCGRTPKIFLPIATWVLEGWRTRVARRILVLWKNEFPKLQRINVVAKINVGKMYVWIYGCALDAVWGHETPGLGGPLSTDPGCGLFIPELLPPPNVTEEQTLLGVVPRFLASQTKN